MRGYGLGRPPNLLLAKWVSREVVVPRIHLPQVRKSPVYPVRCLRPWCVRKSPKSPDLSPVSSETFCSTWSMTT